ncbi:beta-lactamase/transpeptidase-like protein [Hyaloraphidium curvatum]|nr:beta-lactamase/transpeptidase-like protein [Hyaloraphidium curvatum]
MPDASGSSDSPALVAVGAVGGSVPASAAGRAAAGPTGAARFSASRLDKLRGLLKSRVEDGTFAGVSFLLNCDGEDVLREHVGMRDREQGIAMGEDALFRIMSMTKPIVGVAIMILVEEGRLTINTPAKNVMPQLADLRVYVSGADASLVTEPLKTDITIRHLLTHTSGLPFGYMALEPTDAMFVKQRERSAKELGRPKTGKDVIADLCAVPLAFQPGARWKYGESTSLLGIIIEAITGQSLGQFLEQRLFKPLGMNDTAFHIPPEKLDRFMPLYGHDVDPRTRMKLPDAPLVRREIAGPFLPPPSEPPFCSGGGGLFSTLADYAKFCQMMVNGGKLNGARILSPRTVALFSMDHAPLGTMPFNFPGGPKALGKGYGLCSSVIVDEAFIGWPCRKGTYSWGGAWTTHMWIDPVTKLYAVFMTHHETAAWINVQAQLEAMTYSALEFE